MEGGSIMKMSEFRNEKLSMLFIGPAFSGKTVLASQFPEPFIVALDPHAVISIQGLKARYKLDFDVECVYIDDNRTEDPTYIEKCGKAFTGMTAWEKTKKLITVLCNNSEHQLPQDATLIIDNYSRIGEVILAYTKKVIGRKALQIQDWNIFIDEIQELADILKSSRRKCNVISIAHEESVKDKVTGEVEKLILMPTKIRYRIPTLASDYFQIHAKSELSGGKRRIVRNLQSTPSTQIATGSRCLIPDIQYPTYDKMRPYLTAALNRTMPGPNWTPPKDE